MSSWHNPLQHGLPTLPPFNKINLIGLWMEAVLWGTIFFTSYRCIVFVGAIWVLLRKRIRPANKWMLILTSMTLFVFVTAHVALSLRQLLEAFIYIPTPMPPLYNIEYWMSEDSRIAMTKTLLYDLTVWLQDIVLIWRLYAVWDRNWKICVIPFIVDIGHMAAFAATATAAVPRSNPYMGIIKRLSIAAWSLDLAVNVSVTAAISGRLWYMGQQVSSMRGGCEQSTNIYLLQIFTVVESGALFAAATLVMLILYIVGSPLAITAIDIAAQLAVLTPLLIVVRVGLGLTHGLPRAYKIFLASKGQSMTFADRSEISQGFGTDAIENSYVTSVSSSMPLEYENYVLRDLKPSEDLHLAVKKRVEIVAHQQNVNL
ncbi:hypothetical protein B0H21DRAFT_749821 [Amylocystis lapponica]|nr:hypothetical protein B0H21DRAFT_749821 [Amylocystis lapponica]